MSKIDQISVDSLQLNFHSREEELEAHRKAFLETDLGMIYQAIPWPKLIKVFKLKRHKVGRKGHFGPQGQLALMFLKHYACCSDRKLIEQLNANIHWQFFCGVLIRPQNPIKDFKLVSKIRGKLAHRLHRKAHTVQKILASHWKPSITQSNVVLMDATCYETTAKTK